MSAVLEVSRCFCLPSWKFVAVFGGRSRSFSLFLPFRKLTVLVGHSSHLFLSAILLTGCSSHPFHSRRSFPSCT